MVEVRGPRLSAVIFDMDGLLVDSEPLWRAVEAEVFDGLGADIRNLLLRGHTMGMRVDEAIAFLAEAAGLIAVDIAATAALVVENMVRAIGADCTLLPGARQAVTLFADAGLRLGLASGSTPPVIDAVLERFDLRSCFEAVVSAADDPLGKPHPAIFLRAAAALGARPEECLVLEDSLNGCIAAKAARMKVVAVPHARDANDPRFAIADWRLSELGELFDPVVQGDLGLLEDADLASS